MTAHQIVALENLIRQICTLTGGKQKCFHDNQFFIKHRRSVRKNEAIAQQYMWSHSENSAFRVPRVIHYFEDEASPLAGGQRCGFLMMEYVVDAGKEVPLELSSQALLDLSRVPVPKPLKTGPFDDDLLQGYLWADSHVTRSFVSIYDLNAFLNKCVHLRRGAGTFGPFHFEDSSLVICHGDLSDRNVRLSASGHLYILDWAFAGVYPLAFEHFALSYISSAKEEESLADSLLKIPAISDKDQSE